MNTKHLKSRILDLALRGKLVENSQILENSKQNSKALEFPKDFTPPFEIPNSWQWVKLGDIAKYKKGPFGSSLTKSMFVPKSENSVKVYEQKNAIQKNFELGNYFITKEYFLEKMKGFIVNPNDIIISCAGTIGEVYQLPSNAPQGIINQALMRVCLENSILFTWFKIAFDYVITENSHESKGTAIKNIPPFSVLKSFYIPLPPKDEQEKIVKKIDEIFEQIDILDKQKENLLTSIKHTKSRILDLALRGKLVENSQILENSKQNSKALEFPKDFTPPFEIPNSWQWFQLSQVIEEQPKSKIQVSEAKENKNAQYPFFTSGNNVYKFNDFLIEGKNIFLNTGGSADVKFYNGKCAYSTDTYVITANKYALTEFLFYFLYSKIDLINEFYFHGVGLKHLKKKDFKQIYISLPPKDEQEKIVKKLDELFAILDEIQNSL